MQFSCERCGDSFTCKRNLIGHLSRQNNCTPTNAGSPSCLELLTKLTTKHINDINFPCRHCQERFNTKSAMYKHMKKCTTKNLQQVVATTAHSLSNISLLALREQLKKEIMDELQESRNKDKLNEESTPTINIKTRPYKKCKISYPLKLQVWDTWFGFDVGKANCWCCDKMPILQSLFVCGHVIAESKGGSTTIDNLRPICFPCNSSMRNESMRDFALKHFERHIT